MLQSRIDHHMSSQSSEPQLDDLQSDRSARPEMIRIDRLTKTFPGRGNRESVTALEDVSLSIKKGEFVTILGPSGCGKTTLLRAIAGLTSWQQGSIQIEGVPVDRPGPDRAMVFQSFALLPWATVLRNIAFGLELRRMPKRERLDQARALVSAVGLEGFEDCHPHELSGGMQQRVGIARALAVDPAVLLMDEPFGALDEQTRRLLQEELLGIMERAGKTVVFVTHSMEEAVLLGDRIVLMTARPGRIESLIDVPLPRPRASCVDEIEESAAYVETTGELWRRLRTMSRAGATRSGADSTLAGHQP